MSPPTGANDRRSMAPRSLARRATARVLLLSPRRTFAASPSAVGSIMQPTISREAVIDRRQPALRWSAVFAGTICSIGFWILLQILGIGLGLAAIDVNDVRSLNGVSVGTTLWSLVSPLIAMFLGGLLAGKLSQTCDRKLAGAHGLVMWAITSIVGLCATIWIVAMIAGGAVRASGVALDATGNMISSAAGRVEPGAVLNTLGVDPNDLLAPINQRLTAQGKPAITAAQLEAAMRDVVRQGLRSGFDRELFIEQLAANTQLSRAEVTDVARQVEARWDATAGDVGRRAGRVALSAADAAGKALATVGLSLLLSLIASVGGAVLAQRGSQRTGGGGKPHGARTTEPDYPTPPTEPTRASSQHPAPPIPPRNLT